GSNVTEQQILLRLNVLDPGTSVSDETLETNADLILEYLRDRGYFQSRVRYSVQPLGSDSEVNVTFTVDPGEQARVESFSVNIAGAKNEE
ncbi:hypothetical protein OFM21_29650, partial [Escherichia coli]|nr:hypothetical protein [Escherichia coli]